MSDKTAGPHMEDAIREIIDGNNRADGDYLIVAQAAVDENGLLYSWRWAWSPQAPHHTGQIGERT
jgi:hypothetical protein